MSDNSNDSDDSAATSENNRLIQDKLQKYYSFFKSYSKLFEGKLRKFLVVNSFAIILHYLITFRMLNLYVYDIEFISVVHRINQ